MNKAQILAAAQAYAEQDAATRDIFEAADNLLQALARLKEQNRTNTDKTRVAFNYRGGMAGGGSDATRAHDQIRNIIENQERAVMAVRADVERIIPLLEMNTSIANRVIAAMES